MNGGQGMALTRSFKDLVQKRVANDPAFGAALLREGIDTMLTGDVDTGKAILRDYIKATVGFEKLGEATGAPAKSLIRMFGPRGNPQARNLFGVIGYLQREAGVELHVAAAGTLKLDGAPPLHAGGRARCDCQPGRRCRRHPLWHRHDCQRSRQ
jgi:hypothetical protein